MKPMTPKKKQPVKARRHRNDPMTDVILATVAEATAPLNAKIALLTRAINSAEIALCIVPAKGRDDTWMELLHETQIVPALQAIDIARGISPRPTP